MRAITTSGFGGPEVLRVAEVDAPETAPDEVLIDVFATALNRADLLQRRGLYPAPPGASSILGLEFAGVVNEASQPAGLPIGARVMGLLAGGGYAEQAVTHPRLLLPLPEAFSFEQGAAIPEAFLTASEALFTLAALRPAETILIHAAAGGVGSAAVQLAKALGAYVIAVVSSSAKAEFVLGLGANETILRGDHALEKHPAAECGLDVVLDFVGASCGGFHARALKPGGRWIVAGLLGGSLAELDLKAVLSKRLRILGLVMRTQPLPAKIAITERFLRNSLPLFSKGQLFPCIDSIFPLGEVAKAHERMERNENLGKIVLRVR